MDKILSGKLKIKTADKGLVLNAPAGFDPKPHDTTLKAKILYAVVLLFAKDKAALDKSLPKALKALKDDGLFWVAYPKKSSPIKTDITRDNGWDTLQDAGYENVSLIAIDDTWSAMRFRARTKIPVMNRQVKTTGRHVDTEERILEIPGSLEALLKKNTAARKFFDGLSYTNRKEYAIWIASAKKEETLKKRLGDTLTKLLASKKNPAEK